VIRVGVDITGLAEYRRALADFSQRRLDAALATALTRTAVSARDELKRTMTQVFDRPTPWTLRGLWVMPATAQASLAGEGVMPTGQMLGPDMPVTRLVRRGHLEAAVYVKDPDVAGGGNALTNALLPQTQGGQRQAKRLEQALLARGILPAGYFVVPGQGARLDQYGNISRGQVNQILNQLRVTLLSGFNRGSTGATRQRAAIKKAGGQFFVIRPGDAKIQPGIYSRETWGRNIAPVLIFVRRATYRPRLDFDGIVRQVASRELPAQVRRALAEQMARLQAKRTGGAA
jgi:hypothetical protein